MKKKGFTLIEILISVSVLATVGVLIAQAFFTTTRSNTKTEILKDVKQNGDFAMDIMERMVHSAAGVTSVCQPGGTTAQSVTILNPDNGTTTFGCLYDATSSVTRIASTSALGSSQYLTSTNVTLGGSGPTPCTSSSLIFICTSGANQPPKIHIRFTLSQRWRQEGTPPDPFERGGASFQTSVSPRNY